MRKFFQFMCLLAMLCVPGCNVTTGTSTDTSQDKVAVAAYKTLLSSGIIYDACMNAAVDAHTAGKLTEEQWNAHIKRAQTFYAAYMKAVDALAVYMKCKEGSMDANTLSLLCTVASGAAKDITSYLSNNGVEVNEQ